MKLIVFSKNKYLYSIRRLRQEAKILGISLRVEPTTPYQIGLFDPKPNLIKGRRLKIQADVVYSRISPLMPYDYCILKLFESMGIPMINSPKATMIANDKYESLRELMSHGISIPKTILVKESLHLSAQVKKLGGFPIIVKLIKGTQGNGIVYVDNLNSLESIADAFIKLDQSILVQEFIKESSGNDVRVFVVGGRVIAAMKRIAKPEKFRTNIHQGGAGVPINLTNEEKNIAIHASRAIGLQVAGVDILQSDHGPKVIEVNASPGLEGIEEATGVNVAEEILRYLKSTVENNKSVATKQVLLQNHFECNACTP